MGSVMPLLIVAAVVVFLEAMLRLQVRKYADGWRVVTLTWKEVNHSVLGNIQAAGGPDSGKCP